jgi:hypothetical protein
MVGEGMHTTAENDIEINLNRMLARCWLLTTLAAGASFLNAADSGAAVCQAIQFEESFQSLSDLEPQEFCSGLKPIKMMP